MTLHVKYTKRRDVHTGKELKAWLVAHNVTAADLARWLHVNPERIRTWIYRDTQLPIGFDKVLHYWVFRLRVNRGKRNTRRRLKTRKANTDFLKRKEALRRGGAVTDQEDYL